MDDSTIMIDENIKETLLLVKKSLEEKGHNYQNQIAGYLLSGDLSYIPRYNNARSLIKGLERDKIIKFLLEEILEKNE